MKMCDCYLDNPPTFYDCKNVKGRKEHKCDECLQSIAKGEQHEYAKGLWEGKLSDYRTCQTCLDMIKEIDLQCHCHGDLLEEIDVWVLLGVQSVMDFKLRRKANYQAAYERVG